MNGFDLVACDFAKYQPGYLARFTESPNGRWPRPGYAEEVGQMLRDILVAPPPAPYPVDALTRLAKKLKRMVRWG